MAVPAAVLERIEESLKPHGLALRGAFHPVAEDGVPELEGRSCGTILLLGNLGGSIWPAFNASPERADGAPHGLDRWTRRILGSLAPEFGARALFPFGGPPWLPFQRWAMKADSVAPSPLGILIHPDYGLWHAYRGAFAFAGSSHASKTRSAEALKRWVTRTALRFSMLMPAPSDGIHPFG